MSTTDAGRFAAPSAVDSTRQVAGTIASPSLRSLLLPLASLRLTVVLFALSIVLVFAGTLAQVDHDIWYVVHNYFRTWFAWINFQIFFPRAWGVPGGMWFPGGWLIGGALGVNLLAAHALRFKVTAKDKSLWLGLAWLVAGVVITWLVIQSGLNDTVESELSAEFTNGLWHAMRFALGAGVLGSGYLLSLNYRRMCEAGTDWLWWLGAVTCGLLAVLVIWLFVNPEAQLDPSGLRILWQLIKSSAAAIVLLVGCVYLFGQRAGIVLLHGGIGLMMFSELWTGLQAQESQMQIAEGQTVNYAVDQRSTELAIVDKSDAKLDQVTVVPTDLLVRSFEQETVLDDPALPFTVRAVDYKQNSITRSLQPGETSPATEGIGLLRMAESLPINTGVGDAQGVDIPTVYLELKSRQGQKDLGTFLFSPFLFAQTIEVDGKAFEISLRLKRIQKPYAVKLIDFRFDRYVGTNTAKNFSSQVELIDTDQNVDREVTISMNNPLRYHGDTLYQADWDKDTERGTVLQVMTNSGWMIPYVSCMIVAFGMFAQFGKTFSRFANREVVPTKKKAGTSWREVLANWKSPEVWVPALILLFLVMGVGRRARVPKIPATEMQIHEFGQLPVAYNGRIKPFDTLARNTLTVLSEKGSLEVEDENASGLRQLLGFKPKKPATFWLLECLSATPASFEQRIFRVENLDVLQTLELKPREGFRYSIAEVTKKTFEFIDEKGNKSQIPEALRQASKASEVPEGKRNLTQVKFLELGRKLNAFGTLKEAFSSPKIRTTDLASLREDFQAVGRRIESLKRSAPRPVPPVEAGQPWKTMLEAERDSLMQQVQQQEVNAATIALRTIFDAYATGDVQKFNEEVAAYREIIEERANDDVEYEAALAAEGKAGQRKAAEKLDVARVEFEAFFNHFNPFSNAMALYLFAFVLTGLSWLGWRTLLNRSANWVLWFTFFVHTYALVCRIYISGRPPVTNLYSSAVFIGWGAVLFALIFEKIYRFGIGNLLAAVIGFPTLFIAYNLAGDGDTFQVLQAVLDTQFWLATHVVCITLGYSTTLLAGVLGLVYVLFVYVGNRLNDEERQHLIRMTYGTLCFALFFSFVGTVLGGLWGDDSWGRFWGWDPKENGALLIVLWNALVLHARWGAMIRQRGLAVLVIFGNIVTAWSWFGTNQLGVGLHAYGFRKGMTFWLCVFAASQLAVMILGCLPKDFWRGKDEQESVAMES